MVLAVNKRSECTSTIEHCHYTQQYSYSHICEREDKKRVRASTTVRVPHQYLPGKRSRCELGLYFIFPIIFKRGKYETIPTTRGTRKRLGSVAVTGLSNGVLQRRTRRRLLVPFSPARTAEKARQPGYRPQKNSDNVNSKRRDSDSSTNIDRQKPKTAP